MALLRSEYPDKTMIGKEVAMMLLYVIGGWNDATPGALLPSIEDYVSRFRVGTRRRRISRWLNL